MILKNVSFKLGPSDRVAIVGDAKNHSTTEFIRRAGPRRNFDK